MRQDVDQLAFDFLGSLPVIVERQEGQTTSDAGLLPLAEFDRHWNYTARLAACLDSPDFDRGQKRDRTRVLHSKPQMLRQRLFGILAGYEDCNDHDTLRHDPVFKLVCGKLPEDGGLASQPTLSRFENAATVTCLKRVIAFLIDTGVERLKQVHGGQLPESVILDLDATDDPTHGHQQLSLFHGYYGQYQYFPLIISEPTTKHVFAAMLRPGTVHASLGADDDLAMVVRALRVARPDIKVHVRGDAAFGTPRMYEACRELNVTYTLGLTTNARLKRITEGLMDQAVAQYQEQKIKQRLFMAFEYQADSWDRPRTVVAKAECHNQGTNLRFVVTESPGVVTPEDAQKVYDDYTQRGESEQRMDELKNGLKADRLSCHRFKANFMRLLLHTAAFNLLAAIRNSPQVVPLLRTGQPATWRTHVIKVAATVVQSARRIVVKISDNWPWWRLLQNAGRRAINFQTAT